MNIKNIVLLSLFLLFFSTVPANADTNISIQYNPITVFSYPGKSISFRVTLITNNCSIDVAYFLYRATGDKDFFTNSMITNTTSSNYIYTITNSGITKSDIDYFILVRDNYGNYYREPSAANGYYTVKISSKETVNISSENGGSLILSDDIPDDNKKTALVVSADSMFQDNKFGIEYFSGDIIETVLRNDNQMVVNNYFLDDNIIPVSMYDFYLDNNSSKYKFSFRKKVTIYMRYFDENNDGIVDDTSYSENNLKVFYWDNVKWQYIDSELDTVNNVLKVSTEHLNRYAVFYVTKTISELNKKSEIIDFVSNSSFSPQDGEIVIFGLKNNISEFTIYVYDFRGNVIRTLNNTNSWDGRDENGSIVSSGVYLYKVESGDKNITGMLNVIK